MKALISALALALTLLFASGADAAPQHKRSAAARAEFVKTHPCPSTGKKRSACPGFVVDHVVPLKRGGADAPFNMQWQTTAAAKAKDKIE